MTVPPVWATGGGTSHSDNGGNRNPEHVESTRPDQEIYRRRARLLSQRCKQIAQHNRLLVNRIYQVKKLAKRYKNEVKFLMARLDTHGDNFRDIKMEDDEKQHSFNTVAVKAEKGSSNKLVINEKTTPIKKSAPKKKSSKSDKDKDKVNPKKPIISPFPLSREYQTISLGETSSDFAEMSTVDKNRLIASKWKLLLEEKKIKTKSG